MKTTSIYNIFFILLRSTRTHSHIHTFTHTHTLVKSTWLFDDVSRLFRN